MHKVIIATNQNIDESIKWKRIQKHWVQAPILDLFQWNVLFDTWKIPIYVEHNWTIAVNYLLNSIIIAFIKDYNKSKMLNLMLTLF